ncbi:MAG: FAD-dependent oxidoreductase [Pseudomonadota bacterium]
MKIAVIGAGLAGLTLAQKLKSSSDVTVFEKSLGLGGRMSNRRSGDHHFDHGAQYFTIQNNGFREDIKPFFENGTIVRWSPRVVKIASDGGIQNECWTADRYVAQPGMNALAKQMAARSEIRIERATRIAALVREGDAWRLLSEDGRGWGTYDWVISTAPAEQTARLFPDTFAAAEALHSASMSGCYTLMLGGIDVPDLGWDVAIVDDGPLAWIARNHTKPGRPSVPALLVQAQNDWSEAKMDADQMWVTETMAQELSRITGVQADTAAYSSLHRWRFAKVSHAADQPFLIDGSQRLAAAGDWCSSGRVEAAWESADALSKRLQGVI